MTKWIWKQQIFELQGLLPNMEITYIYGIVHVIHSETIEFLRIFHEWKSSRKRKSFLKRLTINTSLFISEKHYFTLFSRIKLFTISHLQTTKLNLNWLTYNTTATLDELAFTYYVDFGKCQDRFGRISWSKNSFDYLDVKLKVFKKDENKQFRLEQNLTMGEADFNQFIWLRN